MKKDNRVLFIDIARGIAILLMIAGHVLSRGLGRSTIFSFHMPLFIIVSGYFYKEKPIKEEIKNLLFHLIIPSTITIIILYNIKNIHSLGFLKSMLETLKIIIICKSYQAKIIYNCASTGVLWYIYMFVIIKILFMFTKKIANNNQLLLFLFILLETYLGYIIGYEGYWLPWSIDISLTCMIFYYLGYIFKRYDILDKIISDNKYIIIILIMWIIGIKYNWIEIAIRYYPNGLWCYITAVSGSIIVLKLSRVIEKKTKYISKGLSWCGHNSLYLLIGHYTENMLFTYNFNIDNILVNKTIIICLKCLFSIGFAITIQTIKKYINKKKKIKK